MSDELVRRLWKGIADTDAQQDAADRIEALEAALAKADELAEQFDLALQELDECSIQLTSENYNCPDHNRVREAYRQARDATK